MKLNFCCLYSKSTTIFLPKLKKPTKYALIALQFPVFQNKTIFIDIEVTLYIIFLLFYNYIEPWFASVKLSDRPFTNVNENIINQPPFHKPAPQSCNPQELVLEVEGVGFK